MAISGKLFCYGTLCFPEVMQAVTGRSVPACRADLPGYARYELHGKYYPVIVPARGSLVSGLIYASLTSKQLRLIDAYEGHLYCRQVVTVTDNANQLQQAWVYVLKPAYYHRIKKKHWSAELFAKNNLDKYIRQAGYR